MSCQDSGDLNRNSRDRPRVAILGVPGRESVQKELQRIRPAIEERAEIVVEDLEFQYDFSDTDIDLVIVLGGDGSILQSARQMGVNQIPVLGINCGRLGFLAALSPDDFLCVWADVCCGQFAVAEHVMLKTQLVRDGKVQAEQLALNEAAVLGGPPYEILDIDLYADGELATRYRCDGLILATPVGSTAHNLSAGGPILRRTLQAVVISPISPHTLTYRPVVDSADTRFELQVVKPNDSTSIVVDGRMLGQLRSDDLVRIERADTTFKMVSVAGNNDYRSLREKLGWGGSVSMPRTRT
ncbi:putative inorganic polyphosphate/ATP-NAD kinase [Rubripirellula lacrimiformis]|uniref:NAD kinase n=1 Tax=Rubripirellula lacrimiformis TaxID=1930273 RepID=A0A517N8W2_9BACT|nr:NAD(+)/NADH kinase [Rubripirellula lacrimiformis]QDT03438.1 putative inorganic polyphosphate/ATP-NAD kinase [Rubripirellula lacrimiformis]